MSRLAPSIVSIRDFNPEVDSTWLYELWRRTIHERWAIPAHAMLKTIANTAFVLVAECEGQQSGFSAIDWQEGSAAGLILLLVEPAKRRSGIATELIRKAETMLRKERVHRLTLGAATGDYFWPGLPQEQDEAWPLFRELGFVEEESSTDLIQVLLNFKTPNWVSTRLANSGAIVRLAEPAHEACITAFETTCFPAWADHFEDEMRQGGHANILCATAQDGRLLGTILLQHEPSIPWMEVSNRRIGTLNTLGVATQEQGQGLGLALTACAMEHLKKRGCSHCFIQWTGLAKWYGKLGAKPWAQYRMASKIL